MPQGKGTYGDQVGRPPITHSTGCGPQRPCYNKVSLYLMLNTYLKQNLTAILKTAVLFNLH